MNHEIRPWGPASILSWLCPKCGAPMHDDHDRKSSVTAYACFKCGSRVYPDYPKRPGSEDIFCEDVKNLAA